METQSQNVLINNLGTSGMVMFLKYNYQNDLIILIFLIILIVVIFIINIGPALTAKQFKLIVIKSFTGTNCRRVR